MTKRPPKILNRIVDKVLSYKLPKKRKEKPQEKNKTTKNDDICQPDQTFVNSIYVCQLKGVKYIIPNIWHDKGWWTAIYCKTKEQAESIVTINKELTTLRQRQANLVGLLKEINMVASGEYQIAIDDTEAMKWINDKITAELDKEAT